ncbi:hypothetical protein JCM10449v2_005525 [Rhodotorula kratochvilovae]
MTKKYQLPRVKADSYRMPHLTPWGTALHQWPVSEHEDVSLFAALSPWTLEREAHYQKFHRKVWDVLVKDDDFDLRCIRLSEDWIAGLVRIPGRQAGTTRRWGGRL